MKNLKLMLVGTSSDAGKSLLTAVIAKHYQERGLRVAPFKAQNMSSRTARLRGGELIANSSLWQARALGLEAEARMNPILLRPCGERRSELFVLGKSRGELAAREYYTLRDELRPIVMSALESLSADYDLLVLEGAGSCAEINLLDRDLVNLPLAKAADIPAVLVADIERGGVFAAIYGTWGILPEELRRQLKAYLINRFRGDVSLLEPGLELLKEKLDLPALGVVPYVEACLEPEDSLSEDYHRLPAKLQTASEAELRRFYDSEFAKARTEIEGNIDFSKLDEIIGL